uniref:phenylacetaldehyde reductase-like n=1 Tax=Erigeron canadensis TaxID=72917 RepID=UPI001CB965C8|nr:phenylacetaldehyde reductase-like [Erigeron canadensis]
MNRQEESRKKTEVCVTGASGYIASWLVKLLLHRGYTVNATVRDLNDPKKTEHLLALDGAKERLHLFQADLLKDGSFDDAVKDCDGVFHTASPFFIHTDNPQEELIDPAVKGTLNVLSSCSKVTSIKRVILTSSVAAVMYNGSPLTPEVVVDESWFSDPVYCKENKLWYPLSKTLAEEAAWKFVKEKAIDMVTINPAMVIGPLLQPTLNTSARALFNLINASTYQNITVGCVHVKDVVDAHIMAFETPSASGRYCMSETVVHFSELVQILNKLYPSFKLPDKCADDTPVIKYQFSKERAKELGINYTPLEDGIKETIESLTEKNFL